MGIELNVKCHHCGELNDFNLEPIRSNKICEYTFTCGNCGALNTLFFDFDDPNPEEHEWLCLPPEGFEWILPAGKIVPVVGESIYISAFGEHLSWERYVEKYRLDPEIAYQNMRRRRTELMNSTTENKVTYKSYQSFVAHPLPNITNVKKIEVLCKKCGDICELMFSPQ
jgi:uncharacterized CHY-type Zn-finger protein